MGSGLEPDPGLAHLWQIFVREPFWGTGVATALHTAMLEEARQRGYARLRLFTPAAQARARRFYEREGWALAAPPFFDESFGMEIVEYRRPLTFTRSSQEDTALAGRSGHARAGGPRSAARCECRSRWTLRGRGPARPPPDTGSAVVGGTRRDPRDQFIQLTEGVIARGARAARPLRRCSARTGPRFDGSGRRVTRRAGPRARDHRVQAGRPTRCASGQSGRRAPASASPGSARATALRVDQAGRRSSSAPTGATPAPTARRTCSTSAASRRATTRRCPWLLASARLRALARDRRRRRAVRPRRDRIAVSARAAAGPLRLHVLTDPTPAARLRRFLRLTGLPPVLPEWAYGHWKSRDVYEHQSDVEDDFEGYRAQRPPARRDRDRLALGDAVQHLGAQPAPVPRLRGHGRAASARPACARWCGSRPGSTSSRATASARPTRSRERLHPEPAPNYAGGARPATSCERARRRAVRRALVDGHRLAGRLHLARRRDWWREQAKRRAARSGVEGIKADDGEGYYFPHDVALRRRPHAAPRPPGRYGLPLPALDAARARRGPPRRAACCSAAAAGPASRRSA